MSILDQFRLDGKVALVTGASRGLGQGMVLGLAEAGADIVTLDRTGCEDTCQRVESLGRRVMTLQVDLASTTVTELRDYVAQVVQEMGSVDILVNNAGIIRRASALEFSEEDWDDVLNINLRSLFFLSQAAAAYMKDHGGGKIIHIASMLSYQGGVRVASYTAAKSAVAGITRLQANEWAPLKINVNAIAPGYMATDNTAPLQADPERNRAIVERIPAGQWGTPDDLKGVVVFLASEASSYMHGAVVPVDGGWLAR